jgi:hypothetical protein
MVLSSARTFFGFWDAIFGIAFRSPSVQLGSVRSQSSPAQTSIQVLIDTSIAVQSRKSASISVSERTIFLLDQLGQFA